MSGQRNKGFRVASGQHSVCKTFAQKALPCPRGQTPSFVAAFATQRVGLGIGYNRLEVEDAREAKNKAFS